MKRKRLFKNKKLTAIVLTIILTALIVFAIHKIKLYFEINSQEMPKGHYYNYKIPAANSVSAVYKGEVPSYKISNKAEMIFQLHLPEAYDNVYNKTDEEIKEYYNSDKESIQALTGIENEDDYVEFIKGALKVGCDLGEYTLITYKEGSYKRYGAEERIELEVEYSNNKKLKAIMHIISTHENLVSAYVEFE